MRKTLASLLQSRLVPGFLVAVVAVASASGAVAATHPAIQVLSGANQQTTYAAAFPGPLTVFVKDPVTQRALSGVRVVYNAGSGIALSATFAISDARGIAEVTATGLVPCQSSVTAEVAGSPTAKVVFDGLIVNKATLTVLPSDLESAGGMAPEIASYSIVGFVHGETEDSAQVTGVPELSTTATADSHYGNYAIKGGVGSLSAPNYNFVAGFGTLAISGAPDPATLQGASLSATAKSHPVEVRPALGKEAAILSAAQHNSNLTSASGSPVRAAILLKAPTGSVIQHASIAPVAMPKASQDDAKAAIAPVRNALSHNEPSPVSAVAHAAIAPASLPGVISEVRMDSGASVRGVTALNLSATPASPASSYTGLAIRKALIVPGTN